MVVVKTKDDSAPLYVTKFAVFPKYEIETLDDKRFISISRDIMENTSEKGIPSEWYSPDSFSCIFSRLATVKDEESLLKFVHQYGLLGAYDRKTAPNYLSSLQSRYIGIDIDSVEMILEEAQNIRYILEHWVQTQKGVPIDRTVTWDYIYELWPDIAHTLQNADEITLTRAYLLIRVSRYINGVRPVANFTREGRIIPGFAYLSLSDAIWYQLYRDMTGYAEFKECPYCHSWHTGRGKFCPAPPTYKRSPCENSFNQKKHRKKRGEG